MRLAAFALALALLLAAAAAQSADRRVVVDPDTPPWNAVAKVQTNIGRRCTGVLVAPAVVLTAAHCLYNPHTLALLQPVSLHVLFGYQRAAYRWHRLVRHVTVGAGFDGRRGPEAVDWARLELAQDVPIAPLQSYAGPVAAGLAVALAGYNQDRAQLLLADLGCHVLHTHEQPNGATLVEHDCAGTPGTSGGPLLTRQDGGWTVAGINLLVGPRVNLALVPAPAQASKP